MGRWKYSTDSRPVRRRRNRTALKAVCPISSPTHSAIIDNPVRSSSSSFSAETFAGLARNARRGRPTKLLGTTICAYLILSVSHVPRLLEPHFRMHHRPHQLERQGGSGLERRQREARRFSGKPGAGNHGDCEIKKALLQQRLPQRHTPLGRKRSIHTVSLQFRDVACVIAAGERRL